MQQQDAPIADDFSDLSEVRKKQIINDLERKLLLAFNGEIHFPVSYGFLRRFSKAAGLDMPTLTLARYILETSLLFYEFICVPDSLMAAAALLMAMRMVGAGDWVPYNFTFIVNYGCLGAVTSDRIPLFKGGLHLAC